MNNHSNMYTNQQKILYLKQLQRLRELYVVKSNIHLTYKYKNRNKAIANAQSLQDKIINAIIDDAVYGNSDKIRNIDSTIEELMTTTLENERKRIHRKDDGYVDQAVELNAQKYSQILTNRINTEALKLEQKIESELSSGLHNGLSEHETRQALKEKYGNTAKARIKNIIKDSVHTNESNISWIKALNEGYSYKVWMNGQGKGKVRNWHRAKLIAPVPIDDYFDIYGSYHAQAMYPGDLYAGAENVANCRCWLRYTNRRPEGLGEKKTVFNIPQTSYLNTPNNTSKNKFGEGVKVKPIETIKTTISNTTKKVKGKIKNVGKKINSKIKKPKTQNSKFKDLFSLNNSSSKKESKKKISQKTKSYHSEEVFDGIDVSYTEELMSKFKKIIKTEYLDGVLKHFEYFKKKLNSSNVNRNIEHCTIRKADGTIVKFYTTNEHKNVEIPEDIQDEGRKNWIHTTIHNHPKGTSPISSPEDISKYAECGVKIGISHNEFGTMIITNNSIPKNKTKADELFAILDDIREGMIKDFEREMRGGKKINRKNPKDLKELNKYVNAHHEKYVNQYKSTLKDYDMKVNFITNKLQK